MFPFNKISVHTDIATPVFVVQKYNLIFILIPFERKYKISTTNKDFCMLEEYDWKLFYKFQGQEKLWNLYMWERSEGRYISKSD